MLRFRSLFNKMSKKSGSKRSISDSTKESSSSPKKSKSSVPTRNAHGELVFDDFPQFKPNRTPKQVLQVSELTDPIRHVLDV